MCLCVCLFVKSMIDLPQSLYDPAGKPFTDVAGIFRDVQASGNVSAYVCCAVRVVVPDLVHNKNNKTGSQ